MSDKVYVGKRAKGIKASPSFSGYTKVVIIVGDDENGDQRVYEAGTDAGSVLEVTNPWGTQQMANDMLARIQGYAYKPISADSAILTPAAELGDGITVGPEYSVLASQNVRFDTLHASDIEAPDSGELEHEIPAYESARDRQVNRKFAGIRTSLRVNYDSIVAEIEDLETNTDTKLSVLNGRISSEINRATAAEGNLSSSITQTVADITALVIAERTRAEGIEESLSAQVTLAAGSITATASRVSSLEGAVSTSVSLNPEGVLISNATGQKFTINTQNNISMSFGDLTDAQAKQALITAAQNTANDALEEASDLDIALAALKTNIGYTYINGEYVISPHIVGGTLESVSGDSEVYIARAAVDFLYNNLTYGKITANSAGLAIQNEYSGITISAINQIMLNSASGLQLDPSTMYGTELPTKNLFEGRLFFLI